MDLNFLKKHRVVFAGLVFCLIVFALHAFAPEVLAQQESLETTGEAAGLASQDIRLVIARIIRVVLSLVGIVFVSLVIYGGIIWMTSGGNSDQVSRAQKILVQAGIGLAIILLSWAITTFVINALLNATGLGSGVDDTYNSDGTEALSDALGSGALEDHYPSRNAVDIPRNAKIIVTFKDPMYITSFIEDYDVGSDAEDVSDDIVPSELNLNTDNVVIYPTVEGEDEAYTSDQVTVSFTEDLQTFVFDPPIMGSAIEDTNYTVYLNDAILDADGQEVFTGRSSDGYEWSFEVSTELDTTPPQVEEVVPVAGSTYDRNITVQITFSEAIDPTVATGTYAEDEGGFTNIQVQADEDGDGDFAPLPGEYEISNGYTVVEFTPDDACGTNSCNQVIYCLPGNETIELDITAASVSDSPPEADLPYDGIVDLVGNSLDGSGDGIAEGSPDDDYFSSFTTTNDVNLDAPEIESISPAITETNVPTNEEIIVVWDSLMRSSTLTNSIFSIFADPDHELWYSPALGSLDGAGDDPALSGLDPAKTEMTIRHGTFIDSEEDDPATEEDESTTQLYATVLPEEIQNLYQNCFYPAGGPSADGGSCDGDPSCCDGDGDKTFNPELFICE